MKNKVEEYSSDLFENIFNDISELEQKKIENKMMIAAKIEDALKSKNWNKKKFLLELGMKNQSIVSKWLSGSHNFTVDTLTEIEHILGTKFLNLEEQIKEVKFVFQISVKSESVEKEQYFDIQSFEKSKIFGGNLKIKGTSFQA